MKPLDIRYEDYLSDESKCRGKAENISFPESVEEVSHTLKLCRGKKTPVTIQGARTGLSGGAVPNGGHILSMKHMNHIKDLKEQGSNKVLTVEAGVTLEQLESALFHAPETREYVWIPSPTESLATVGGVISNNAQGINSFYYGSTEKYIQGVKLVLPDGEVKKITKDTDSELFSSIIGSEGTIGVIVEADLILTKEASECWGICFFFEEEKESWKCVDAIKQVQPKGSCHIRAVEYFDHKIMKMIMEKKRIMTKLQIIPDIEEKFFSMLYVEIEGEEMLDEMAEQLLEITTEYGSDPDETWAFEGKQEIEKMKIFRHAAPEIIGLFFEEKKKKDDRLYKVIGDYKIKGLPFEELMTCYQDFAGKSGIQYCIFGHAASNHVLLHFLPETYAELERAEEVLREFEQSVESFQIEFPGEQGVGKTKKKCFIQNEKYERLLKFKKIKDPDGILNSGNIF